jgi:hypothetical protein
MLLADEAQYFYPKVDILVTRDIDGLFSLYLELPNQTLQL